MTCLTIFGITFSCFRLPKISAGDISILRAVKGTPLAYIIHDALLQKNSYGKGSDGMSSNIPGRNISTFNLPCQTQLIIFFNHP